MTNYSRLKKALQRNEIIFDEERIDGNRVLVIRYEIGDFPEVVSFCEFKNDILLSITIMGIGKITDKQKKLELYDLLDEYNKSFSFGRYLADRHGNVYINHCLLMDEKEDNFDRVLGVFMTLLECAFDEDLRRELMMLEFDGLPVEKSSCTTVN